jgi:long-subunit acyl-CoA synthetase (AMP-forming)
MRDYKGDIKSFRPTIMGVPAVWELVKEAFYRRSTVVARFARKRMSNGAMSGKRENVPVVQNVAAGRGPAYVAWGLVCKPEGQDVDAEGV